MKTYRKLIAGILAVVLSAGITGTFAYAKSLEDTDETPLAISADAEPAETVLAENDAEPQKDETVYVIAHADGAVDKIIVSDWLKNPSGADKLTDTSDLENITNVRSDSGYTVNSDGALVWNAAGDDLYYQGTGEDALPVDLSVSYELDGKPISAEELAGKSGKVKIRFDYKNNESRTVDINGKKETIYVPFAMLTGVMLDNDCFHNVEISSGKILSDGTRTIAAGFALPGMQETLGIDPDKAEIPASVEITADVTNFKLGMTVTIAANDLFGQIDTDKLNDADDLTDAMDELTDAMNQLMDGSDKLYDGLETLLDKSGELVNGIHALADGAKQLKDGTVSLSDGAGQLQTGTAKLSDGAGQLKSGTAQLSGGAAQLADGAAQLSDGLNTLTQNNDALNGGAKQVFDTLLQTANTQIAAAGLDAPALTIENYGEVLTAVIGSLDAGQVYQKALEQVTAGVEANRELITEKVTAAVREQVEAAVLAEVQPQVEAAVTAQVEENRPLIRAAVIQQATGMGAEDYDAAVAAGMIPAETQAAIDAAVEQTVAAKIAEALASDEVQAKIQALTQQNTDAQMQSEQVQGIIAQQTEAQIQKLIADTMASDEVQAKLASASAGAQALMTLKTQLDSYNAFYMGLQQYTAGVAKAAAGAAELKSGTDSVKAGANQLDSGADALRSGAAEVNGGAGSLQNGAQKLQSGAAALYDGILKLEDGVPALTDGVTALKDGAKKLSDGMTEFDEKGIKKLSDAVQGDLANVIARMKAAVDVSREYATYSGKADSMNGKVKFIYKTEEIGQ